MRLVAPDEPALRLPETHRLPLRPETPHRHPNPPQNRSAGSRSTDPSLTISLEISRSRCMTAIHSPERSRRPKFRTPSSSKPNRQNPPPTPSPRPPAPRREASQPEGSRADGRDPPDPPPTHPFLSPLHNVKQQMGQTATADHDRQSDKRKTAGPKADAPARGPTALKQLHPRPRKAPAYTLTIH